jgi:hypothetical protein
MIVKLLSNYLVAKLKFAAAKRAHRKFMRNANATLYMKAAIAKCNNDTSDWQEFYLNTNAQIIFKVTRLDILGRNVKSAKGWYRQEIKRRELN